MADPQERHGSSRVLKSSVRAFSLRPEISKAPSLQVFDGSVNDTDSDSVWDFETEI